MSEAKASNQLLAMSLLSLLPGLRGCTGEVNGDCVSSGPDGKGGSTDGSGATSSSGNRPGRGGSGTPGGSSTGAGNTPGSAGAGNGGGGNTPGGAGAPPNPPGPAPVTFECDAQATSAETPLRRLTMAQY